MNASESNDTRRGRTDNPQERHGDHASGRLPGGRFVRRVLVKLLATACFILLPLFGLAAKHAITVARQWWARRDAMAAATSKVAGDDPRATAATIIEAMRASPDDAKLQRTWAAFLKQNEGPAADRVSALKRVLASGDATDDDRSELALALVADHRFAEARAIIDALPESLARTTEILEARAVLRDETGDHEAANVLRRAAWSADPGNRRNQMKLTMMDLGAVFEEKRSQALMMLWDLAQGTDDTALDASDVLAGRRELTRPQADQLLRHVRENAAADKRHVFLALGAVIRTHPEESASLIDAEVKASVNYGPEDRVSLAAMLDRAGAYEAVLAVVPQSKALLDHDLCVLRIKALSKLKHFGEISAMLDSRQRIPLSKGHVSVLQSFLQLQMGAAGNAIKALAMALDHAIADHDEETIQRVVVMAGEQGWWDLAAKSSEWLAASGTTDKSGWLEKLFQAAKNKHDAPLMLATAERIAEARSANASALTSLAYLRLLLGSRMETVPELLGKLQTAIHEGARAVAESASLVEALLCFRFGDQAGVKRNLAQVIDWTRLPPGQRAIGASLLKLSGNDDLAFDVASALPALAILDEEKDFWLRTRSGNSRD